MHAVYFEEALPLLIMLELESFEYSKVTMTQEISNTPKRIEFSGWKLYDLFNYNSFLSFFLKENVNRIISIAINTSR